MSNLDILEEKIKNLEQSMDEKKKEINALMIEKETTLYKLDMIQKQLDEIEASVKKNLGWNGFFIDFIKVAAQIAALVAAGKFIF